MALPEGLLEAVRNYLDITWEDAAGDGKLSGIIARGIKYLDKTAGEELDYTVEDKPRELLMDYCRYARSNALDEFQQNYLHELLSLQIDTMVAAGIANAGLSALTIGELVLTPEFSSTVYEYTATAFNDSDIITATPVKATGTLTITVNNELVENEAAAEWVQGQNIVLVTCKYEAISLTYTVVVTR